MADLVLWARTQAVGPQVYRTVVAAVPFEAGLRLEDLGTVAFVSATAAEADERTRQELERLGARLREHGHRIVDVVLDQQGPFDEERRLR